MFKRIWNDAPIHLLACVVCVCMILINVVSMLNPASVVPGWVHLTPIACSGVGLWAFGRRIILVARRHEPDTPVNSTRIKITTRGDGSRQFEAQRYSHVDDWRPLFRHDLDGVAYDDFVSWQQEGEVNREDGTEINAKKLIDLWLEQVERETITSTTYVKYP